MTMNNEPHQKDEGPKHEDVTETTSSHESSSTHKASSTSFISRRFKRKVAVVAVIAIGAIVYNWTASKESITAKTHQQANEAERAQIAAMNFDEQLLACNEVNTAEPTEAFATCLTFAQEGNQIAVRRMIWAYSRAGDYQSWQNVFNWLKALRYRDKGTQFLIYAIMHLLSDNADQKKTGEEGINTLVTRNFAPANVFMASIYALNENQLPPANNPLWLLERAYQKDQRIIDASRLALVYANDFLGATDLSKASMILDKAAQTDYPINANNIAWFLSTIDENPFFESQVALDLALSVVENDEHKQNPIYVDTLAAAYAANGSFENAVATQQEAIDLLLASDWPESRVEREKAHYEKRLALYKEEKALVEETLAVDKTIFFRKLKTNVIDYLFRSYYVPVKAPVIVETQQS